MADHAHRDRTAGMLLIASAGLALAAANSPLAGAYHALLETRLGPYSLHAWVSDGLMAVFFLLVGLEVKREWIEGRLSTPAARRLPVLAAAAGMAIPALVYLAIANPDLARGWAIPAATDIAFALGVLALLGTRAPPAIKLLLVAIAVIDDIGAVVIIALAYSSDLSLAPLAIAGGIIASMAAMARLSVRSIAPYLAGFVLLWLAIHASGVHATVAGVLAALTVPLGPGRSRSTLERLEHGLHPWVMMGIVPLFGFASAGVALPSLAAVAAPLPLAVALGLIIGKQVGIFGALWLADRSGIAPRPPGVSWPQLYGAALLCGIGFTMSLFIGALAFPGDLTRIDAAKVGTLAGSLVAAVGGWLVLRWSSPALPTPEEIEEERELFGGS